MSKIHNALSTIFKKYGLIYKNPFYYPTLGEYASLLESRGFKVKFAMKFERVRELKGENSLADWIDMFIFKPFEGIDKDKKNMIINEVVELLRDELKYRGNWYVDHSILRISAKKLKQKG
ncbi:hypothetical protein [Miniphocaeibacter massiliensis]|uniref:hypothetical protein n=1 Tax=Miniphocaeibacter massiliensis TaxID=2041841 RepID=UPI001F5E1C8A|nr:hypothetical protein [Miniphocaeibacter massiliensis]